MVVAYGVATFLQALAATRSDNNSKLDPGLLWRLAQQKTYLAGVACQGIGTVCAFIARRELPLFLVQAAMGATVVVTALLGVLVLAWRLPRSEIILIAMVLLGIVALVAAAEPGKAKDPSAYVIGGLVLSLAVIAVLAHFAARLPGAQGSVTLGALSGAAFGAAAIASRPLVGAENWQDFVTDPLLYVFLVQTIAGQLLLGMALQRGATTAATASMTAMVAVPPALIGLWLLGDQMKAGMSPVATVGFTVTVVATVILAWYAEPQSHSTARAQESGDELLTEQAH
ncbi:MAG: hypothetical protein HOQ05_13505 [Corynebacteriales bacterium]|nr:hypothetical protein [Mycobacteriales bacterium]